MADKTGIEWTDATWNPVVGCSVVSPGCTNCYAMKQAARIERMAQGAGKVSHYAGTTQTSKAGPVWTGEMRLAPDHILTQPLRWSRPRRIFVNSMSDLFHENVPDEWIDRVFAIMALAPQHTFQVLTKRSSRMRDYLGTRRGDWMLHWPDAARKAGALLGDMAAVKAVKFPLPNVWLGVSTEDQRRADERIPDLCETPAAVRFISAEPLLGAINLRRIAMPAIRYETGIHYQDVLRAGSWSPRMFFRPAQPDEPQHFFTNHSDTNKIDLVIVGGESGPGARPMHPDWARSLRDQCTTAGTAFFFKQWGSWEVAVDRERDDPDWRLDYHRKFVDAGDTKWLNLAGGCGFHGERFHVMRRASKHAAGRLLDGIEHNAMPEVRS